MPEPIHSYQDLLVWQKSMKLCESVYSLTSAFPHNEKFGFVSQMRRSALSIPSNIAEGRGRNSRKDFIQFLHIASGSANELELEKRLSFCSKEDYTNTVGLLIEVKKMLAGLISSLKAKS